MRHRGHVIDSPQSQLPQPSKFPEEEVPPIKHCFLGEIINLDDRLESHLLFGDWNVALNALGDNTKRYV